jgi:hypothetical protein
MSQCAQLRVLQQLLFGRPFKLIGDRKLRMNSNSMGGMGWAWWNNVRNMRGNEANLRLG